jgi:hypothetical protein
MTPTPDRIRQRIVAAFSPRGRPEGSIFESHSDEVDMPTIERLAREGNWIAIPHDVLCASPLALAFMTPEAFAWFLPAFMVVSVASYAGSDTLTSSVITCLTPPDEADARQFEQLVEDLRALDPDLLGDEPAPDSLGADAELLEQFVERAARLTLPEKAAVRDYLEYIDVAHGADFPAFGPKQALDRYWAAAARSGGQETPVS